MGTVGSKMIARLVVTLTVLYQASVAFPVGVEEKAFEYLTQFGYIDTSNDNAVSASTSLRDAVKKFQEFGGIEQTGVIDRATRDLMDTPRCGVGDTVARFVQHGSQWKKTDLTFRVSKYPTSTTLSRKEVDDEVRTAFNMWEEASGLRFGQVEAGQSVDIDIVFERFEHGDRSPFDGPKGVLAHAFFPAYGGNVHMDDSEDWSVIPFKGSQLLNTLTHELGHSLGLRHSNIKDSIMAPFYKGWTIDLRLDQDDVKGIQSLYGKPKTEKRPSNARPALSFPEHGTPTQDFPNSDRPTLLFPVNDCPKADDLPKNRPTLDFPGTNGRSPNNPSNTKPSLNFPSNTRPTDKRPPVSFPGQENTVIKRQEHNRDNDKIFFG